MPLVSDPGVGVSYVDLGQNNAESYPFNVATLLVFDAGIVGSAGTVGTLNIGQDTLTLAQAGLYTFAVNVFLAYDSNVTGYKVRFGDWESQAQRPGSVTGGSYALVSGTDFYVAGYGFKCVITPNLGAGLADGSSNAAYAAIARIG